MASPFKGGSAFMRAPPRLLPVAAFCASLTLRSWNSASSAFSFSTPPRALPGEGFVGIPGTSGALWDKTHTSRGEVLAPRVLGHQGVFPASLAACAGFVAGIRRLIPPRFNHIRVATTSETSQPLAQAPALVRNFCNLFAVWLAITAVVAARAPSTFLWVKPSFFTGLLGLLMFSVGVTTTIDDFKRCLTRPGALAINFLSCYGIMPALAYVVGRIIGAEGPMLAGLVFVGSINGGQSSNLCTLIAGGDVALSVLMTTVTTLGCIVMTPLICKIALGAVVPVDAAGIISTTVEVLLAPIFIGVAANTFAPKLCRAVSPYAPTLGVTATVLLVGSSVASCASPIVAAGGPLQLACLVLHLVGGILGYFTSKAFKFDEQTSRTVAIETAMKSSAFAFLLASYHFAAFDVRVPSAVSVVWNAIVGSLLAVYWKGS